MIFRQYYLGCLSHASYLIGDESTGQAVVVDPQRDVSGYLRDAAAAGLCIGRVIETHLHADFVSGHLELAAATGATILYGDPAETEFPSGRLRDGERIRLGEVEIEVRATPGHTPESICLVLHERAGDAVPYGVLTGDTLFIGDVGRPDLGADAGASPADMARQLYRSLHRSLLNLPDATRVFPAHGAGSACGRNLSTATESTIGEQRRTNHALAPMPEEAFVALVTEGQPARPPYFGFDARRNREQHPLLIENVSPPRLSLGTVLRLQRGGGAVLDTRSAADFAAGHLRGALNVALSGRFAEYAGDVVRADQPMALVCHPGTELEARIRLARIGFDAVTGYLPEPTHVFVQHPELVAQSTRLTAEQLAARLGDSPRPVVLDVRNTSELDSGVIEGSTHVPLAQLAGRLGELDATRPVVVHCAGGHRSSIAASLLAAAGFADVSDLLGGYQAWSSLTRATPAAGATASIGAQPGDPGGGGPDGGTVAAGRA